MKARSFVREIQFVDVDRVGRLLVITIHLIVGRDSVPTDCGRRGVSPVQRVGSAVKGDRLVIQLVIGGALDNDCQVVPSVLQGITGNSCGNPLGMNIVPDIPFIAAGDTAFVAPGETHVVEVSGFEFRVSSSGLVRLRFPINLGASSQS